nr:MAG TPA: hypothetical protein [Caudoviricetes sp.]
MDVHSFHERFLADCIFHNPLFLIVQHLLNSHLFCIFGRWLYH